MIKSEELKILLDQNAARVAAAIGPEVKHLISSGACDDTTALNLIIGVALENIADGYLAGSRKTKAYRNLKRF